MNPVCRSAGWTHSRTATYLEDMLPSTLKDLCCPRPARSQGRCAGPLKLFPKETAGDDVMTGELECERCKSRYPILAGVAVVVADVRAYLLGHVKGISRVVPDSKIPKDYLHEFREAKAEIETEHIEEDLEAERVTSLYLMNHYLRVATSEKDPWWLPKSGKGSPLIESLIRDYWDNGPFAWIEAWAGKKQDLGRVVELGCGVGGLHRPLAPFAESYLGLDSSFASIVLARHLSLGAPYSGPISIPSDLLDGPTGRKIPLKPIPILKQNVDFIVGDLDQPPIKEGGWDLTVALNAIDMLEEPAALPELQYRLLKSSGIAVQSCPYIWHEAVSRKLRARLPKDTRTSAEAVEWMYRKAGFTIRESQEHLPWLFFKNLRQLEVYSVHIFTAERAERPAIKAE